ncbi:hypothetical protein LTR86_009549 [Recurvomyces mirabilis]|nr:hypothetical protein LTR86_009549 [Recurvomyces mirabilis]
MATIDTTTDVLIIGAGAASMMAATCAAAYGLQALVIDKRPDRLVTGHGDSLNPRTLEILEIFGLAERMLREGSLFTQWAPWAPGSDGALHRTEVKSWSQHDSRYTNITLTQARIGEIMAEYIREKCADIEIRRATILEGLSVRDGEEVI